MFLRLAQLGLGGEPQKCQETKNAPLLEMLDLHNIALLKKYETRCF